MIAAIGVPPTLIRELARRHLSAMDGATATMTPLAAAGANGDTALLEIASGARGVVFFLKRLHHGLDEARIYRALHGRVAPIPDFVAAFTDDQGQEVLILERLAHPGLASGDAGDFAALLDALAAFNALPSESLPRPVAGWLSCWYRASEEVWCRCESGAWGAELAAKARPYRGRLPHWRQVATVLEARLAALPAMTTHHDPAYANAGRRIRGGPVVLFDLHQVDAFPRLRDLALCLGGFHQPWPAAHGRRPWIERYCDALASRGGPVIAPEQAEAEVRLHLAAHSMWMDRRTIVHAEGAWARDPIGFAHRWGDWFARAWAAVDGLVDTLEAGC